MRESDYQQIVLDLARRVEDLELYHWRPPHGYAIVARMMKLDDTVKWVWVRAMTQTTPYEESRVAYVHQLDCIKDLKAHIEAKEQ